MLRMADLTNLAVVKRDLEESRANIEKRRLVPASFVTIVVPASAMSAMSAMRHISDAVVTKEEEAEETGVVR